MEDTHVGKAWKETDVEEEKWFQMIFISDTNSHPNGAAPRQAHRDAAVVVLGMWMGF